MNHSCRNGGKWDTFLGYLSRASKPNMGRTFGLTAPPNRSLTLHYATFELLHRILSGCKMLKNSSKHRTPVNSVKKARIVSPSSAKFTPKNPRRKESKAIAATLNDDVSTERMQPTIQQNKMDKGKAVDRNTSNSKSSDIFFPSSFTVIAGSYERLLYGLQGSFTDEKGALSSTPVLKPIFIFPAHVACVKAVAASPEGGKWLASGSSDEIVKVWDLRRRKEIGGLLQHEGVYNTFFFLGKP